MQVTTIGIDLAKNVFQVPVVDANDKVVFNKPLRRSQVLPFFAKLAPCLIGMEETIPSIGVLGASAIVATVPDASIFKKDATSRPGSASSRARIRPAVSDGSDRSPNRATATCGAY